MTNKLKYLFITLISVILLTSCSTHTTLAVDGNIDLTEWSRTQDKIESLDGQWRIFGSPRSADSSRHRVDESCLHSPRN